MIYYIADTHFNHANIIRYCNRPFSSVEKMNNTIIDNWNKKVKKDDDVYILGDFCFGNKNDAIDLFSKLNGRIHFIRGNHDRWLGNDTFFYIGNEKINVYNLLSIKDKDRVVILCHYPIESWNRKFHGSYHLYGHVHNSEKVADIPNRYNVGADVTNFSPVTLDELIGKI